MYCSDGNDTYRVLGGATKSQCLLTLSMQQGNRFMFVCLLYREAESKVVFYTSLYNSCCLTLENVGYSFIVCDRVSGCVLSSQSARRLTVDLQQKNHSNPFSSLVVDIYF